MKKLFYSFLFIGILLAGCNKTEVVPTEFEISFSADIAQTGFKASVCDDAVADHAVIKITGLADQTIDVFYLDGKIYTNTIKITLPAGTTTFTVTDFAIFDENNVELYATPYATAEYAQFVNFGLPADFTVAPFTKTEVNLDVLCFEGANITNFGFAWFAFNTVTVREFAFFGDFCTKYFEDYTGSLYEQQAYGLRHDMPAIFKIEVKHNGTSLVTYDNEDWLGEGQPLLVQFPDYPGVVDTYDFVLSILVKVGTNFEYKEFYTWTTTDANPLANIGSDNVMDFVLGSCVPDADLVLPPYMNLPVNATMTTGPVSPGTQGTYFDVVLSGIGAGYDIQNGTYGVYCADHATSITLNKTYGMNVYSSLYPQYVPNAFNTQKAVLDNINWLGNNLYRYAGHDWRDIQNAVWMLLGQLSETDNGGIGVPTAIAIQMKNDAIANGDGYLPPVGGWAAVLFISPDATSTAPVLQLLFTLVDP